MRRGDFDDRQAEFLGADPSFTQVARNHIPTDVSRWSSHIVSYEL